MKKKLIAVLAFTFSLMLTGCGDSKIPDGMGKESYSIGNKAIEAAQAYIDGDKTAAATVQTLSDLYDQNEKLLVKDSKTGLDGSVSLYISFMQTDIKADDSFSVLDDIEYMQDLLTPVEDVKNLSDVIVGSWSFKHDNGATLEMQFNADGSGTYDTYNENGKLLSPSSSFEYSIDDKNKSIIKELSDGSNITWFQIDTITNKYMTYTMPAFIGDDITGTAYKNN